VTGPHPFFNVHTARLNLNLLEVFGLRTALYTILLEIAFKMLKQGHFFVQLLRVVNEVMLAQHVLLLGLADSLSFIVVKQCSLLLSDDLSAVIEENSCSAVREQIAQTILATVVNPLLDPHTRQWS